MNWWIGLAHNKLLVTRQFYLQNVQLVVQKNNQPKKKGSFHSWIKQLCNNVASLSCDRAATKLWRFAAEQHFVAAAAVSTNHVFADLRLFALRLLREKRKSISILYCWTGQSITRVLGVVGNMWNHSNAVAACFCKSLWMTVRPTRRRLQRALTRVEAKDAAAKRRADASMFVSGDSRRLMIER